ncbi:MAG: two-component regulator propeller domain-containing protein [Anaerolineae bacterium]
MKGSKFETIRWALWLSILIVLALAGCEPSAATPTPTMAPAAAAVTETAPAATPTATALPTASVLIVTPAPLKSPTVSPTVQHNTPTLEPTPTPIPTILAACPTPIFPSSIIHRDDNTGWRHYWASSSQQVSVNALAIDGQWLWIATTKGVIRLNQHSQEYRLFSSTGTSPDIALDQVLTLAVDDQGRLWAGGEHGLVRYTDGVGWKVIYPDQQITNFGVDHEGNLWAWLYGDTRFRPVVYQFQGQEPPDVGDWQPKRFQLVDESLESYLNAIDWRFLVQRRYEPNKKGKIDANGNKWSWQYIVGEAGQAIYHNGQAVQRADSVVLARIGIWTGDRSGLFYHNGQTLKRYRFATDKAMVNHPRVYDLAFTADGTGWATTSEGLFRFNEETEEWQMITKASVPMPFEDKYVGLVASGQQSIPWIYTPLYLLHFNGESWEQLSIPINIAGCWEHRRTVFGYQGDFWLNCGPWRRFDGSTWGYIEPPSWVNQPTTDHNGKLYAISDNGAILVYDGTDWQQLPECAECRIRQLSSSDAIAVDATGRVWGAYDHVTYTDPYRPPWLNYNSSIWRYSTEQGWCKILELDPVPYVLSLLIDAYGDLWVLHSSDEVLRCNQENCEAWRFGDDQPFDAPITAMAMDPQGRIWIGGYGLLSVYDPAAER